MTVSLNNSVVSASAFYDHHRHIDKADIQQALAQKPEGGADAASLNDVSPAAGGDKDGEDSFSFFDLLDIFNPLQHIPVISSIYRAVTGDEINGPARILGGALYGGPVGMASGVVNAAVDEASGRDVGEHVMLAFTGGDDEPGLPPGLEPSDKAPVMVAENAPASGKADNTGNTEFRAGPRSGDARDARTLAQGAQPVLAEEAARDAAMASSLLHENASRAEARAGDGAPTPPSPAAQQATPGNAAAAHMPTALQPPLAPGMVVQTMMENLDAYGEMAREQNARAPENVTEEKAADPYFGS